MTRDVLQDLRFRLQRRVRRLASSGGPHYHAALSQLWLFCQGNVTLAALLDELEQEFPEVEEAAIKITETRQAASGTTYRADAALCLAVIRRCLEYETPQGSIDLEVFIGGHGNFDDAAEAFHERYVEPLFEYVDERIDESRLTLALLLRYRTRCELFHRDRLRLACEEDPQRGEDRLTRDLFEYLFTAGREIQWEPRSASGRVDLIESQSGEDRLVAEAKVFNPQRGLDAAHVRQGFTQIRAYMRDHDSVFGYLVVFQTGDTDLDFAVETTASGTPFIQHDNRTTFVITIDLREHKTTASKRKKPKVSEITSAQLIQTLTDSEDSGPSK